MNLKMKNYIYQLIRETDRHFPSLTGLIYDLQSTNTERHNHDYNFQNKVAIVTGASSGIGKEIAKRLVKKNAIVILAARNKKKLEKVIYEIKNEGGMAVSFPTDVTNEKECEKLIDGAVKAFGHIDILVNNAGISMRANFADTDLSVLKRVMDTNFWGTVYCTKYALPYILKQKGKIIGISSICGITPLPGRTGYAASKHAMDGFLESLRLENLENNLHVMLVHPGFTASNIRNVALNKDGFPQIETPLNEDKLMPAERVAKEVLIGIVQRKSNITLTREGKLITWIYKRMPGVAEKLIYREMIKETGSPF
jgi:short-subunit dehydrogenase